MTVFGGEITDYSAADARGLGFRGLVDGKMGYASSQALDEDAVELLVEGARENARLIECEDEQFLFAGGKPCAATDNYNPEVDKLSAADKIRLCKSPGGARGDLRRARAPRAESTVFSESGSIEIVNTLGLRAARKWNLIGGAVQAVAADGERVGSGFSLFFENDPGKLDAEKAAREAAKEAVDGLSAQSAPSARIACFCATTWPRECWARSAACSPPTARRRGFRCCRGARESASPPTA